MSHRIHSLILCLGMMLHAGVALAGGPTRVTLVTNTGFHSPSDAVASPDGATFYFAAFTERGEPAIFQVSSQPGSAATVLFEGAPLQSPTGLVLSCDGATLYIADGTAMYSLVTAGGADPVPLKVTNVGDVVGLAMGPDCTTLHATGHTRFNTPALFSVDHAGGAAQVVFAGSPLVSPGGLFVDARGVAWVMDHVSLVPSSSGVLYAVAAGGRSAQVVASGLDIRATVGGVSLNSVGGTAVIPTVGVRGNSQLTTIDLATGSRGVVLSPAAGPGAIRTARKASVFVVVDSEAGAIYRAE